MTIIIIDHNRSRVGVIDQFLEWRIKIGNSAIDVMSNNPTCSFHVGLFLSAIDVMSNNPTWKEHQ